MMLALLALLLTAPEDVRLTSTLQIETSAGPRLTLPWKATPGGSHLGELVDLAKAGHSVRVCVMVDGKMMRCSALEGVDVKPAPAVVAPSVEGKP